MNELTQLELTQREQDRVDKAFNNVGKSYLDCCIVVAGLEQKQEAIARHRKMSQSAIAQMAVVGKRHNKFINTVNNQPLANLPTGWGALYQLSDLNKTQIKELCAGDKPPTRKQIKEKKIELGLLDAPADSVDVEDTDDLHTLAMLDYAFDKTGMNEFAQRAIEQDRQKIADMIDNLGKAAGKKAVDLLIEVLQYQSVIFNRELKRQLPQRIKEAETELRQREADLQARERQMVNGIPDKEKKLVYSVVHPDKAPAGQQAKYAKAFDIVRKWH